MRITHVITGLDTGGAEMMLYKLLSRTDRSRFESSVVSLTTKGRVADRIEALGIPVHAVQMPRGRPSIRGSLRLASIVKRLAPEIIQGWMSHANLAAQFVSNLMMVGERTPVVWGIRGCYHDLRHERRLTALTVVLEAKLSRLPRAIVNVSRASVDLYARLGCDASRVTVIPNGFDLDVFRRSDEAYRSVRSELGLAPDALLIGLIGRWHAKKDHATFLAAMARHPELHALVAGLEVDADNRELAALVERHGLAGRVHALGNRRDVPRLMAALDLMVSASYTEGFSNVIAEAMSCEVPCVVTDVGDSAWIVGDTGRVVPPRDPAAIASAMAELLSLGDAGRRALGARARARMAERFSLESVVSGYESLYERIHRGHTA